MTGPKDAAPAAGAATEVGSSDGGVRGTVRIAPAVLIDLIELAIQDLSGSAGLRTRRQKLSAASPQGACTWDNGKIGVTISGDQIAVSIAFAIERGTNVTDFSVDAQQRIGFAVGNMLGMTVQAVDVYIEEIVAGSSAT